MRFIPTRGVFFAIASLLGTLFVLSHRGDGQLALRHRDGHRLRDNESAHVGTFLVQ
jgi:hypothetical protein